MTVTKNWKTYYTFEEAKSISDENIIKSANLLIADLKKAKKVIISNNEISV
jgi:hypothetical protein